MFDRFSYFCIFCVFFCPFFSSLVFLFCTLLLSTICASVCGDCTSLFVIYCCSLRPVFCFHLNILQELHFLSTFQVFVALFSLSLLVAVWSKGVLWSHKFQFFLHFSFCFCLLFVCPFCYSTSLCVLGRSIVFRSIYCVFYVYFLSFMFLIFCGHFAYYLSFLFWFRFMYICFSLLLFFYLFSVVFIVIIFRIVHILYVGPVTGCPPVQVYPASRPVSAGIGSAPRDAEQDEQKRSDWFVFSPFFTFL